MSAAAAQRFFRSPSLALRRATERTTPRDDRSVRLRLGWVWGLLLFNVMPFAGGPSLIPVPSLVGRALTQLSLLVAFGLALTLNRRLLIRRNFMLFFMSLLCVTSAMMSVRGYFGVGSMIRAGRLVIFVSVLWLLTPWWGRRDMLVLRMHVKALCVVIASVVIGAVLSPGKAFASGDRLGGAIWSIPSTQVAHYTAMALGLAVVLWMAGSLPSKAAFVVAAVGAATLILTETRTAMIGLVVGLVLAAASLFASRRRVRRAVLAAVGVALVVLVFNSSPTVKAWFQRGQSAQELTNLTGRTLVWHDLLAAPVDEAHRIFGYGMSNDSFDGGSIDSSWLSTYYDQGLFGDLIDVLLLVTVLVASLRCPRGPARAAGLFVVGYCAVASITETGLGDASTYLLDLFAAMSAVAAPLGFGPRLAGRWASLRPDASGGAQRWADE